MGIKEPGLFTNLREWRKDYGIDTEEVRIYTEALLKRSVIALVSILIVSLAWWKWTLAHMRC